jgi:hypothetical protein
MIRCIGLAVVLMSIAAITANGAVIYSNDFEGFVGSEWSSTSTDITPANSRAFLGQFAGDDAVSLSLNNLPVHNSVTVSFDLFVIQSWDGADSDYGPDVWRLSADGGPILLNTTFSNTGEDGHQQSYPGSYSDGGVYDAYTGAAEINTLGYEFYGDSVYRLSFTFNHVDNLLKLNFAGIGLQDVSDESWGLDNVTVAVGGAAAIPEPSTIAIFTGIGLFLLCHHRNIKVKTA